ncbi:MAG: hypothetical protein ACTSP4_08190 [Candidatus Hodarchaeales archaeon]
MDFDELFGGSSDIDKRVEVLQQMLEKFVGMMLGTAEVVDQLERQIWALEEKIDNLGSRTGSQPVSAAPAAPPAAMSTASPPPPPNTAAMPSASPPPPPSTATMPSASPPPPPSSSMAPPAPPSATGVPTPPAVSTSSSGLPPLPSMPSFQPPPASRSPTMGSPPVSSPMAPPPGGGTMGRSAPAPKPSPMALQAQLKNELAAAFKKIRANLAEEDR